MNPVFYFDEYKVRPIQEGDRRYIDELTGADAFHTGRMTADWFLDLKPGEDAWAIEDRQGRVLVYFKTQTAVRLSLQFADGTSDENRRVLSKGMAWLEAMLVQNQFRELLFDTQGPALKAMAKRRLGFHESAADLTLTLPAPDIARALAPRRGVAGPSDDPDHHRRATEGRKGHWHHQPMASGERG